jgi:2-oxo-4-hydroxy-4-carboxy-5-ureidoimidazoline decarboxylase
MTIDEINALDQNAFVEKIGWVFEHSPWVAERAWSRRPFASIGAMHQAMRAEVEAAEHDEQLALLRAHPDLGTRARMSENSTGEQSGAGLDRLTESEFERLRTLNEAYQLKFGFPFLLAVKGSTKFDVLEALERRLKSTADVEFAEALAQVYKIAAFRLGLQLEVLG